MTEQRLQAVTPVARGLIDAVRDGDRSWVASVCQSVESGVVDWRALLVALAGEAAWPEGGTECR
ncbi:hypothetical protein [Leucobacter japonicus]|uniref:hypothetical protein n=1 Tax=Leucobacter japonicus TaxID=1461259 RepID=UPI000B14829D|nr:hypothetical protein [Leucobacter japonicus]